MSWSKGESAIKNGYGINQWGEITYEDGSLYEGADLQVYLNKMYYGGDTTVICCNGSNNITRTCPKDGKGNFLTLDETSKSLIDNHSWNIGAADITASADMLGFYDLERGDSKWKNMYKLLEDNVNFILKHLKW